jgi:adenylate cyclase
LGVGPPLLLLGKFPEASRHLEQSLTLTHEHQDHHELTARFGTNPRVSCLSWGSLVAWLVGYPDQALSRSQEALRLAEELSSPFTLTLALTHAIYVHQCRREASATLAQTDALIAVCTEQHLPSLLAFGVVWRGWALAMQGQVSKGIEQIRQGMTDHQARGAASNRTVFLALLADVCKLDGQVEAGLCALDEALVVVDQMGERWYEAELYRLRGDLLLSQSLDNAAKAESCFHQSLEIARRQEAKSWELRAATSVARLWQSQGKRPESHELLEPVYGWFTEGLDTVDLQEAKALLAELA